MEAVNATRAWRYVLLVSSHHGGWHSREYTYSVNAPAIVKSTFGADRGNDGNVD